MGGKKEKKENKHKLMDRFLFIFKIIMTFVPYYMLLGTNQILFCAYLIIYCKLLFTIVEVDGDECCSAVNIHHYSPKERCIPNRWTASSNIIICLLSDKLTKNLSIKAKFSTITGGE